MDLAVEAGGLGDEMGQFRNADLFTAAQVYRIRSVIPFQCCDDPFGTIPREQELTRGLAGAPHDNFVVAGVDRFDALADERRNDVRRARVEIVARPIQVGRQQVDGVEAVLLAVRLRLDEQHLLGQAIRRVGFLGVTAPQVFLAEGHRRELGVGADGADGDELLHA